MTVLASGASAQIMDCNEVCDPYFSSCSDYCDRCDWINVHGECMSYSPSTCAGKYNNLPCTAADCTPDWQETSRVNVGTYDGNSWSGCTHHRVDEVTMTDINQCNTHSSYWSYTYCHDWIDSYKTGCCWPSCCSGYGDNGIGPLTCNGVHSC